MQPYSLLAQTPIKDIKGVLQSSFHFLYIIKLVKWLKRPYTYIEAISHNTKSE